MNKLISITLKALFAVIIFTVVGLVTLFIIKDVTIPQDNIVQTIPQDRYLND